MHETDAPMERTTLPPNARKPLADGESYIPMIPAESGMLEVTARSVVLGLVFCAVFAMASAYLALKVGQGIEAAIPIAILAIGIGQVMPRRSTLLENVIVQSVGANSSHVVSGAVFTLPALYMLAEAGQVPSAPTWYQSILTAFLGGCLGILFFAPLRHYFMVEQHGKLPWPEATATTEILISGQRAGGHAIVLAVSAAIGFVYDGLVTTCHAWKEKITFETMSLGEVLKENFMTLRILNASAVIGIGYIVGLRYAAVICAGSFLSWFVLVPMVHAIGAGLPETLAPGTAPIGELSIDQVFKYYVRIIGVGGIAGAGIMGILSAFPSMIRSMRVGLSGLGHGVDGAGGGVPRTDRSLPGKVVVIGLVTVLAGTFLFFSFGLGLADAFLYAAAGTLLCGVIAFLFAPVSARAIAIVGTNPVSGMTMLTIIVTGLVMRQLGLEGGTGMFVVMLVGGVVCTSLASAGALASDLKVGHWIGATPRNQLALKFLGTLVAATFCGLAMWVLAQPPLDAEGVAMVGQGMGSDRLPAPQASAMKEILVGIMGNEAGELRWYLFSLGAILSVVLRMAGVPALAFALGMYLPIQLNVPVLIGGILAWVVGRKREGEDPAKTRAGHSRGILIASGLIAGGALVGVFDGILNITAPAFKESLRILTEHQAEGNLGEWISLVMLIALCAFLVLYSRGAKADPDAPDLDGH